MQWATAMKGEQMSGERKFEGKFDLLEDIVCPMCSLDKVLRHSTDVLFWYNFQTLKYDYLSESILDMTGYTREEVMTRGPDWLLENMHPDDKPPFLERFLACENNTLQKNTVTHEYRFRHKDGHTIWISEHARIVRDSADNVIAITGCGRDVTEQKQLRQQLAESEQKYKDLYHNAKAALFRTRISDAKLLECSKTLAKIHGYDSVEECLKAGHFTTDSYVDKNRRQQLLELLDKFKEHKRIENFPAQVRRADGTTIWLSISAEIFPEQGYIEGAMVNITASKILTKTEMRILRIILTGKSNKGIAYRLDRSVRTIEDHRSNIMRKLGVDNIVDLTRKALQYGIIPDDE